MPRVFANLAGHDIVAEFDAAVDALMASPAIIIDLRGNLGGSATLAQAMAGRFLTETFVYGREYWGVRMPTRAFWSSADREVVPRGKAYQGEVIILTDALNVSSAEEFLAMLVDSGRATTVGRRSGGSTGNPIDFQLGEGAAARFSTGELRRPDGTLIEGIGFEPDVPVTWTHDDVLTGRDPDLEAALNLLR